MDIAQAAAADDAAVEVLLDRAFGPGRQRKTAQRLREGRLPADGLAFAARQDGVLVGTLTFWEIDAGGVPALLLGPVAVEPERQSEGIGARLIRHGLAEAARLGHRAVVLVGEPDYYGRFGFVRRLALNLALPGPVEAHRVLALELEPGALATSNGMIRGTGRPAISAQRAA